MKNKRYVLAERPKGTPNEKTWTFEEQPVPELRPGELLVETAFISLDPAMRGWMNDARSYIPPVAIGDVMRATVVGEVTASKSERYKVGQHLTGTGGVQTHCVVTDGQLKHWFPVVPAIAPLEVFLGTLGTGGLSAYFGLMEIGKPVEGETVLVSGAAGSVGSVVGQIAKIKGCRVVGIAGGPKKCAYLTEELGFDAAIDYRAPGLIGAIKDACPEGIDIFFDNVGGEILDAALTRIARGARVVVCGAISQYNTETKVDGPSNYLALLVQRARMEGFVVIDYLPRAMEALAEMAPWVSQGKLNTKTTIVEGIENFPAAFARLFTGDKTGKLVLKP